MKLALEILGNIIIFKIQTVPQNCRILSLKILVEINNNMLVEIQSNPY